MQGRCREKRKTTKWQSTSSNSSITKAKPELRKKKIKGKAFSGRENTFVRLGK